MPGWGRLGWGAESYCKSSKSSMQTCFADCQHRGEGAKEGQLVFIRRCHKRAGNVSKESDKFWQTPVVPLQRLESKPKHTMRGAQLLCFYADFLDQPQLQTQPKHSPKLCLGTDKRPASSQGCTTYRNCINKTLRPYTKLLLGRLCARKLHSLSQANVTVNTCGQAARTAVCVGTEQAVRTISS